MKKFLLSTVITVASAVSAQAQSIDLGAIRNLPVLHSIDGIHVLHAPRSGDIVAAVQPSAYLNFTYQACAGQSFDVSVEEAGDVLLVSVLRLSDIDCMGPTQVRSKSLQISSDFNPYAKVIVLNPIGKSLL